MPRPGPDRRGDPDLFDDSLYIRLTLDADTEVTKSEEGALIELFKKQRPGEPPSIDAAKNLLNQLFFDPKRYDLTRVGATSSTRACTSTSRSTPARSPARHHRADQGAYLAPKRLGIPESGMYESEGEPIKDFAAEAQSLPRSPIADRLDEYEHFGNRRAAHGRRADPGGLPDRPVPHGARRPRAPHHRGLGHDHAADDHQHPPVVAALKEFFGSSQLSQFMDQTNSLSGLTPAPPVGARRWRPHARARAHRGARRAPTHYGRMCPIETPEGRTSA